jgi:glycosyltransferase involved in cell wall biosynthesis
MRVLIVSESLSPRIDGVAVATLTEIRRRQDNDEQVHLLAVTSDPAAVRMSLAVQAILIRPILSGPDGYPLALASSAGLRRIIDDLRPDLIQIQTLGPLGIVAMVAGRAASVPMTLTWGTDLAAYARQYPIAALLSITRLAVADPKLLTALWRGRSLRSALSHVLGFFDEVIVPSRKARAQIVGLGYQGTLTLRRTHTVLDHEAAVLVRRRREDLDRRVVLYLGRISREKNLELLVGAFESAHREDPTLLLRIVGPVGDRAEKRRLVKALSRLGEDAQLLPAVPHPDVLTVLAQADIHVMPSMTDMQCLTIGEARSLDVPVVLVDADLAADHRADPGVYLAEPTADRLGALIVDVLNSGTTRGKATSLVPPLDGREF